MSSLPTTPSQEPSPYSVSLEELIDSAQVPREEQVAEQESEPERAASWAWDEPRRQRQLGGGA